MKTKEQLETTIAADLEFVKGILPSHYEVTEAKYGAIRCKSRTGIRLSPYLSSSGHLVKDAEDDEHWEYIFQAIKQHFGARFQEVDHNTCFCHVDFVIFFKQ